MKIRSGVKGGRAGGGWDANHNAQKIAVRKMVVRTKVRSGRGGWDRNHNGRKN